MSKKHRSPHRYRKQKRAAPGTAPGVISVPEDALVLTARTIMYNEQSITETEIKTTAEIKEQLEKYPNHIHWFDVKGFKDKPFLERMGDLFGILRLQMEDVVNVYQRPKMELYAGYVFFISRVLQQAHGHIQNEQLSIFLGKNYVITFQDEYEDVLDPVRDRIRHGKGYMRKSGADYLVYSLMDVVVDNYYPILEQVGDRLDELQDELINKPTRDTLNQVLEIKRELIMLRRIIWSERDKMNDILRSELPEISAATKVYFRDTYDHCIQLLDLVESYKEVTASLMDVYHSSLSNRMNQVMKVLTIISTIFIPLTFIVGVYGMNFSQKDPETGQFFPMNMPELYAPYGYISVIVGMIIIVVLQLVFFYRKGWLDKN